MKAGRKPDWMLSDAVRFDGPHDPAILSSGGRTHEALNPRWSLQVQGFPPDWLDAGADWLMSRSATALSRKSLKSSAAPSSKPKRASKRKR
jgi:hypothetical protein